MIRQKSTLAAVLTCSLIALTGCASSPPVNYYQLEALDQTPIKDSADSPVLALGPILLPDYLGRTQMVIRGEGARLQLDEFNRWAEPLKEAVPRIVASNLDGLVRDFVVVQFGGRAVAADFRLFGSVRRFDADTRGQAVLIVQWGMNSNLGEPVLPPRTARYETSTPAGASPEDVAQAMSSLLADFSRDIALAMSRSLAELRATDRAGQDNQQTEP